MQHPINTKRQTLTKPVELTGKAVHSGADITMRIYPQKSGAGIHFIRTDLEHLPKAECQLVARYDHVIDTRLCTTIGNSHGVTLSTIEHLMAAFAGCGIDDALIEINGSEVPVMDGSSKIFVDAICEAGIVANGKARDYIKVLKPVEIKEEDRWARLSPSEVFKMKITIDFPDQAIGRQSFSIEGQNGGWPIDFNSEIASARTFGFLDDLDQLKQMGLAQGASLENTIAIKKSETENGQGEILNKHIMRFDDEFVRHKALDAVGDLALAAAPIIAKFESYKGGHWVNNQLLRKLFADKSAYTLI